MAGFKKSGPTNSVGCFNLASLGYDVDLASWDPTFQLVGKTD